MPQRECSDLALGFVIVEDEGILSAEGKERAHRTENGVLALQNGAHLARDGLDQLGLVTLLALAVFGRNTPRHDEQPAVRGEWVPLGEVGALFVFRQLATTAFLPGGRVEEPQYVSTVSGGQSAAIRREL